jgi:chorismate mutase/prephenate dehydratase
LIVPDAKRELDQLRQEMENVDAQLLTLLDGRARAARRIGELRRAQVAAPPIEDQASLRALLSRSGGDMPAEPLREIFGAVYAACLSLELPVKVVFSGAEGGPAHAAASGRFGHTPGLASAATAASAVEDVSRKRAEFAVVPLETSNGGPVPSTILPLSGSELRIVEVLTTALDLHVMNRSGEAGAIARVFAAAPDHAACRTSLVDLGFPVVDVATPIEACRLAAETTDGAALALEAFGARSNLAIARRGMLDSGALRVRHAVVGARPSPRTSSDVTSYVFAPPSGPGAVMAVLHVLEERGIDVEKIHAVPSEGAEGWAYLFYVESPGHFTDRPLVMAFEEIKRTARFFKVLGSYPSPPR